MTPYDVLMDSLALHWVAGKSGGTVVSFGLNTYIEQHVPEYACNFNIVQFGSMFYGKAFM